MTAAFRLGHPSIGSLPFVDFPASGTMRGQFEIQSVEDDHFRGDAGRNGFPEYRARYHNVGHDGTTIGGQSVLLKKIAVRSACLYHQSEAFQ
ncbi:MAG: hypothetical protein WCA56_22005 [Xanthobacteraceae bacterium]